MRNLAIVLCVLAASAVAANAAAMIEIAGNFYEEQFIVPVAVGGDWYGDWPGEPRSAPGAFDNQPTWDDANDRPVGGDMSYQNIGGYANRWIYMDFGPDWENIYITQAWTHYRPWNDTNGSTPYLNVRWDDDVDHWNGGVANEPRLNWHVNVPVAIDPEKDTGNGQAWYLDADTRDDPAQAMGRYLWMLSPDPDTGNMNEWAIRGVIVPEPASMSLLLVGAAALLRRKR